MHASPINNGESDKVSIASRAWLIFILCSLFYFYQFILQVSPDVMGSYLEHELSANEYRLGGLSAAFFLSYTLLQIPAGILLDRIGSHRLLTLASLLCALGAILFALAPYIAVASMARLLMGAGAAFVFIGSLSLISQWFPSKHFTLLTGIFCLLGILGAMVGEAPMVYLVAAIGWRETMFILGGLGFIIALLLFLIVRDGPAKKAVPVTSAEPAKQSLMPVLKNKQMWLVAIYTGLLSIPPVTLCSLYGIPFLTTAYAVDNVTAADLITLLLLGLGFGSPVWGWISDRSRRRLPPMIAAAVMSPICLLVLIYYPFASLLMPKILLFALGFFSCGTLPAFSMACEINKPVHTATALGIINTLDTLGATIALPLLGLLLDIFWSGTMGQSGRVYTLPDFKIAMTVMVVATIIPLFFLPFIRETHAKNRYE